MKIVIGYWATPQGIDAINLGVDLARAFDAELEVVLVLKRHDPFSYEYPPTGGVPTDILLRQGFDWIKGALEQIPDDVVAHGSIYADFSIAEGLKTAAQKLGASMIVVGAASASPLKRHRLGTIAHELLFGAKVPIALAPRGYSHTPITRINCAVGLRPGAGSLVGTGVDLAYRANLPLRLLAFMGSPEDGKAETEEAAHANAEKELSEVVGPTELLKVEPSVVVDRLYNAEWQTGDIMFVGSSRVAESNSVFAGSVAMSLLRTLTLPLVVVPRKDRQDRPPTMSGDKT